MTPVVIVQTGLANMASVEAALARLGWATVRSRDPDQVRVADRVVLPGVGAFGAALPTLCSTGLGESLRERIEADHPTLAICLGFQALAEKSEEARGVAGLGCISGTVVRLPDTQAVPQLGWNRVEAPAESRFVRSGHAYFANSYCLREAPEGWIAPTTTYGVSMIAAIERGAVLGCQFHPELSGAWGADLLERWLNQGGPTC